MRLNNIYIKILCSPNLVDYMPEDLKNRFKDIKKNIHANNIAGPPFQPLELDGDSPKLMCHPMCQFLFLLLPSSFPCSPFSHYSSSSSTTHSFSSLSYFFLTPLSCHSFLPCFLTPLSVPTFTLPSFSPYSALFLTPSFWRTCTPPNLSPALVYPSAPRPPTPSPFPPPPLSSLPSPSFSPFTSFTSTYLHACHST